MPVRLPGPSLSSRLSVTDRSYSTATGATDGSIIAAIISVHTPTKASSPRPIVAPMAFMPRACAITANHATPAINKSAAASRVRRSRWIGLSLTPAKRKALRSRSCPTRRSRCQTP